MDVRLAAVAELRSRLGGRISLGIGALPASPGNVVVPTGLPALDARIGGLPRGRLADLVGRGSSGKVTLLFAALRKALEDGAAALVDLSGTLFPSGGWAAGRLLVVHPRSPQQALRALDVLVSSGAFALVALEASGRLSRRGAPEAGVVRLARLARESGTAVVACADRPLFAEHASLRLELHPDAQGRLGVEIRKNRQGPSGAVSMPRPAFPLATPLPPAGSPEGEIAVALPPRVA